MLKSMTGYGRGYATDANLQIEVECRSVNHRYCNINVKLPRQLTAMESEIRRQVGKKIGRGRIDIFVNLQHIEGAKTLQLDIGLSKQYYQALQRLKHDLSLEGDVSLELLARNPNLFDITETEEDQSQVSSLLETALNQCLDNLDMMRIEEGKIIGQDIINRCDTLEKGMNSLSPKLAQLPNTLEERIKNKLEQNPVNVTIDEERIMQEVMIYITRSDTTEEVVRFKSHLGQFQNWLASDESPIGKKLDFLIQEMNRELTTLNSKVSDSEIIQDTIDLKSELEKIREQVQNIE